MAGHVFEVQIHAHAIRFIFEKIGTIYKIQYQLKLLFISIVKCIEQFISCELIHFFSGTRRIRDYVIDHLPAQQSLAAMLNNTTVRI